MLRDISFIQAIKLLSRFPISCFSFECMPFLGFCGLAKGHLCMPWIMILGNTLKAQHVNLSHLDCVYFL